MSATERLAVSTGAKPATTGGQPSATAAGPDKGALAPVLRARTGAALLVLLLLAGAGRLTAEAHRDPKAVEVADAVEKAVAPDGGWGKVAGLRFTSRVLEGGAVKAEYRHLWDLRAGRYRLEWNGPDGAARCVIFDTSTKQGSAWQHLLPPTVSGPGEPEHVLPNAIAPWFQVHMIRGNRMLQDGYARFINDTHWLLMPLKMKETGVNLDYEGEEQRDGETYDVVRITFDHAGLTSGDTHWVFVNRRTHLVDRSEYIPQDAAGVKDRTPAAGKFKPEAVAGASQADETMPVVAEGAAESARRKPAAPVAAAEAAKQKPTALAPVAGADTSKSAGPAAAAGANGSKPAAPVRAAWLWKEWQTFGPLTLSTGKSRPDGSAAIQYREVEVLTSIPAGAFDPPK